ncbi:MAG TPA: response regulator [Patescibacteria group bacterium]|nr:response regulator [Patescibacteria group bacterium]
MKKKKALLIEDDRPTGEACVYMLEKYGMEVAHVRRGEDALEAAERQKPDVVLVDIRLAGEMDGYAVMKEFKRHPFLARVPILIVTNYGLMQDVERGKASGAKEYLVKSDWSIREIAEKALAYAEGAEAEKAI